MTRGRRREKTYTGFNGAATDVLRGKEKNARAPAGQAGSVAAPSTEGFRAWIAAGQCPYCGRDDFKNLAGHTHRSHGVSAAQLREIAGMIKGAPLCSPDLSARFRALRLGQRLPDLAYERLAARTAPRQFSEAGKAAQRGKALRVAPDRRQAAARASGDKQLTANAARHEAVLSLYAKGLGTTRIAAELGENPKFILQALKRAGVWVDGRSLRWQRPT